MDYESSWRDIRLQTAGQNSILNPQEHPRFKRGELTPMPDDWSREEIEATISDYFRMLERELKGEPFNKREHNRGLQAQLRNRSAGAIEFKHQNISAILIDLRFPYIEGYKPARNWQ